MAGEAMLPPEPRRITDSLRAKRWKVLEESKYNCIRKMNRGSKNPVVFMPWVGEYGIMLMFWARYIHHFNAPGKVVFCRKGDEPYFPTATKFDYEWEDPVPDKIKNGTGWRQMDMIYMMELREKILKSYVGHELITPFRMPQRPRLYKFCPLSFIPEPTIKRGLAADVVFGCRKRAYNPDKNWLHWEKVAEALKNAGFSIGLVGVKDTTFDLPQADVRAWDYGEVDASANIELIKSAKLYIGTDTGTTHLASMCNIPMLVFRDPSPWEMFTFVELTTKSFFRALDAWNDPRLVIDSALAFLGARKRILL